MASGVRSKDLECQKRKEAPRRRSRVFDVEAVHSALVANSSSSDNSDDDEEMPSETGPSSGNTRSSESRLSDVSLSVHE